MGSYMTNRIGSSTEFLDQRPFARGDDTRHINWQAFARTEQVMVNLFQQESAPVLDVVLDCSPSMYFTEKKWECAWKLWAFFVSLFADSGARVRGFIVLGETWREVPVDTPEIGFSSISETSSLVPRGAVKVPFTQNAFRVFISDLLFEEFSNELPLHLAKGAGGYTVLAPFSVDESNPSWLGNIEFRDVEGGPPATHLCDSAFVQRYVDRYNAHFAACTESIQRHGGSLFRLNCEEKFSKEISLTLARSGLVVRR